MTMPVSVIGDSAALGERYVGKAVDQWLLRLEEDAANAVDRLSNFIGSPLGGFPANPKAQRKWVERAKKAFGASLLAVQIAPGKRGRFGVVFDWIQPTTASVALPHEKYLEAQELDQPLAWVSIGRFQIIRSSLSAKIETQIGITASFTRHALIRLIQRSNCKSINDIGNCIRSVWGRVSAVDVTTRDRRSLRLADAWIVPVDLPTTETKTFLVLGGPSKGDIEGLLCVRTVLTEDLLSNTQFYLTRLLDEAFNKTTMVDLASGSSAEFHAALEACRNI